MTAVCDDTRTAMILRLDRVGSVTLVILNVCHISVELGCAHRVRGGHSTVNKEDAFLRRRGSRCIMLLEMRLSRVAFEHIGHLVASLI